MNRPKQNSYLILAVFATVAMFAAYGLGSSLNSLLIAFVLAYLLRPLILRLEALGLPRYISIVSVFLVFSAAVVGLCILFVPPLIRELHELFLSLPEKVDILLRRAQAYAHEYQIDFPVQPDAVKDLVQRSLQGASTDFLSMASPLLQRTFSNLLTVVLVIINIALIPLFFVYLVHGYESMRQAITNVVPPRLRPEAQRLAGRVHRIVQGYIYGQGLVAIILAFYYSLALYAVQLRFGIVIGALTGLMVVLPYVGFALGLCTAIIVGLTDFSGWGHFSLILLVYTVGSILESGVITPRLVGSRVGLHPLLTILALVVGGNILGFVGLLTAVPVAATIQEVLKMMFRAYQRQDFYLN
jgi:predicted PurR-regulated permease PerM